MTANPATTEGPLPRQPHGLPCDADLLGQRIRQLAHELEVVMKLDAPDLEEARRRALSLHALLVKSCDDGLTWGADKEWARQVLDRFLTWCVQPIRSLQPPDPDGTPGADAAPCLRAMRARRSVRFWLREPVPRSLLLEILEAATWAPSAFNRQPWRFCVVENEGFGAESAGDASNESMIAKAPVRIYIAIDSRLHEEDQAPMLDAGTAAMNLLLAAHAHGLGACLLYQGELVEQDSLRDYFALGRDWTFPLVVLAGYAAEEPRAPGRVPIAEIVTFKRAVRGLDTFLR
jgi:nitroreductase